MTTIDQQLSALLAKFTKAIIDCEGIVDACKDAENYTRELSNSTIETIDRDINEAADKADEAQGWAEAMNDRLLELREEIYGLNSRLTSGAAATPLQFQTRHRRMLAVLDSNAGCTVEHVAGSLGISVQSVYGYANELKHLGFPVRIKAKRVWFDGDETRLVECKTFKLDPSDRTGEQHQAKEA